MMVATQSLGILRPGLLRGLLCLVLVLSLIIGAHARGVANLPDDHSGAPIRLQVPEVLTVSGGSQVSKGIYNILISDVTQAQRTT